MPRRASTASSSACSRSATPPMRSSAPSARRSTRGSKRSAQSASRIASIAISISPSPPRNGSTATLKVLAPEVAPDAKVIAVDFSAKAAPNLDVVEAEVTETINLNSSRSDKETYHLELTFDGPAPAYKPGDSLDLYAENDPAYVDALLMAARVSDAALRADFIKSRDVTTLSLKTLETYAGFGQRYVRELARRRHGEDLDRGPPAHRSGPGIPGRARCREAARADAPARAPRLLDRVIAREVGDEAHLLDLEGRLPTHNRARKGVASNYAAGLKKGARVRVKLKPNKHFALPAADRDIIMVGPGTGVAPFRAFVQERRATQGEGPQLAVLRRPQFTHDFLYQTEWQDALKDGGLTRMDVAFSRDTPEKVYVQHRIWEKRRDRRRMARRRREFLRLRRHERDGEGCARHAGARLRGREVAVA